MDSRGQLSSDPNMAGLAVAGIISIMVFAQIQAALPPVPAFEESAAQTAALPLTSPWAALKVWMLPFGIVVAWWTIRWAQLTVARAFEVGGP